jgi:aspartate aminotransferase
MAFNLSKRVQQVKPSTTLILSALAQQLKEANEPIINLTAGEPDFNTPEPVRLAIIEALKQGQYTKYTPVEGMPILKKAIIEKLERDHHLSYASDQIIVSTGAKQVIYNLMQALLNPGDEVIMPAPYWVSYPSIAQLSEAVPIPITTGIEQAFKIKPAQLEQAITPRTRLFIINSPCNPTGAVYTQHELHALGEVLKQHPDIIILSDDIYERILWTKAPFKNIVQVCPELYERTFIVNGVSKAYAMTGWRIGYGAGPVELVRGMSIIQSQSTSCPNALAQVAAYVALTGDQSEVQKMREVYQARSQFLTSGLNKIEGVQALEAEGGFYSFPSFETILNETNQNDRTLAHYLLEEAKLATVPGSSFGMPNHLRLSFASDQSILYEAIERLKQALPKFHHSNK